MNKNEISFVDYNNALSVVKSLINENYIVMLSKEEDLWIVDYIWSAHCDRNDVIFMDREDYEWEQIQKSKDEDNE